MALEHGIKYQMSARNPRLFWAVAGRMQSVLLTAQQSKAAPCLSAPAPIARRKVPDDEVCTAHSQLILDVRY